MYGSYRDGQHQQHGADNPLPAAQKKIDDLGKIQTLAF
jgi:hypothetical protein